MDGEILCTNRDFRKQMMDKVDVLFRVKDVTLVAGVDAMPTKMVAEFYEVATTAINQYHQQYKNEFIDAGFQKIKSSQWESYNIQMVDRDFTGNGNVKLTNGNTIWLNSGYTIFYSPRAVLLMGMLLDGSRVGKKVRALLLKDYKEPSIKNNSGTPSSAIKDASNVTVFRDDAFGEVRIAMKDGDPWFVAADVCKALDVQNPTDAIKKLDDDEKARLNLGLSGGNTNCINEPGLYSLALGSRKPKAKAFKRWITHEVIPTIRKTGGFVQDDREEEFIRKYFPSFTEDTKEAMVLDLRTQNKTLREENKLLDVKNKLLSEKVVLWEDKSVINALVRKYASDVCNGIFGYGWNEFKKQLLYKHNINIDARVTRAMTKSGKKTKPRAIDMIKPNEYSGTLATAIAMCENAGVDISQIVNKILVH